MLLKADKNKERQKRHLRVRNHIHGTAERPRLNVSQDSLYIYVQLIDDENGVTLTAAKVDRNFLKDVRAISACANQLTRFLIKNQLSAGITEVVFDNGCEFSQGRALSALLKQTLTKAGIKF